jgi:hypothetical protein
LGLLGTLFFISVLNVSFSETDSKCSLLTSNYRILSAKVSAHLSCMVHFCGINAPRFTAEGWRSVQLIYLNSGCLCCWTEGDDCLRFSKLKEKNNHLWISQFAESVCAYPQNARTAKKIRFMYSQIWNCGLVHTFHINVFVCDL